MLPILEVPTVRRRVAPISVETYHRLAEQGLVEANTELLRGVIIEKISKSPLHVAIVRKLFEAASAAALASRFVRKEDPLTLRDSEPEPDIAVVEGRPEDYRQAHPRTALLVIEVAVSTEEADREKAAIYAEAGIPEYWLVCPEKKTIEVFARPDQGRYLQHRFVADRERLEAAIQLGLVVVPAELFA
jgi:Uma2 family endonuclease